MYGELYLDRQNWKPFIPTGAPGYSGIGLDINEIKIWNAVNESDEKTVTKITVDANSRYFDLWNGQELKATLSEEKPLLIFRFERFGCLLQLAKNMEVPETAFNPAEERK